MEIGPITKYILILFIGWLLGYAHCFIAMH